MKMKIAVLSSYGYICHINNYGSLLQYYALQTFLEKQGHDVYWIKFVNLSKRAIGINRWLREKILKSNFKIDDNWFYDKNSFSEFIDKYIHLSKNEYYSYKELKTKLPQADLYIVGSDQVWNGFSPERYLLFVPCWKPKISYAVSFGKNTIKKYLKPLMKYYLRNFKAISVREKSGIEICKSVGRQDAKYVIDPTFLLSKKDYMNIINNEKIESEKEPYIFSYFVNPFGNNSFPYTNDCNELKEKTHCRLIVTAIQGAEMAFDRDNIINPSPLKWIELIANADYILTNSFHGMAFSIIMKKQFLVIPQKGVGEEQNVRQIDLLSTLNLKNRIFDDKMDIFEQIKKPINWSNIELRINQFIDYSKMFLFTNLVNVK